MTGVIMHLAIAELYIRNHPDYIKNKTNFIQGCLAPDFAKNKYYAYFRTQKFQEDYWPLIKLINNKNMDLDNDFWKGYILHLYVDSVFYTKEFLYEDALSSYENDDLSKDFNYYSKRIIEKYNILFIPVAAKQFVISTDELPKYLNDENKIYNFIEQMSKIDLDLLMDDVKRIKEGDTEGEFSYIFS